MLSFSILLYGNVGKSLLGGWCAHALYNADGHLVGSRSKKYNTAKLGEMKFADDTAIVYIIKYI